MHWVKALEVWHLMKDLTQISEFKFGHQKEKEGLRSI